MGATRMEATNRAVVVTDLQAGPEKWKIVTKEKPRPGPGQVLVRITLRPVNPTDYLVPKLFLGHLKGQQVVVGSEGVGYVEEVGEGVTKVKVGQRVVPSFITEFNDKGHGSWQDYVVAEENQLYTLSHTVPDEVASQFILNPWALYCLLKDQDVPKGEYLLQDAAGSSLGREVIQLAKHWGIKTINIVRRDDVKEELKSLGADEVINSSTEDLVARVKEITGGKGAYGAIDAVGGILTKKIVASVRDGGKVFVYGLMDSSDDSTVTLDIFDLGRVDIRWWFWRTYLETHDQQEVANAVGKLFDEKVLVPLAGKVFKFEDFKEALLEADKPGRRGKVLLAS